MSRHFIIGVVALCIVIGLYKIFNVGDFMNWYSISIGWLAGYCWRSIKRRISV